MIDFLWQSKEVQVLLWKSKLRWVEGVLGVVRVSNGLLRSVVAVSGVDSLGEVRAERPVKTEQGMVW